MAAKKNENLRLAGILVLVFDTDEDARDTLKANLEFCGAIVSVAASSREVLAILAQFRPHVIVTDLTMPDEDCYELLNEVRNLAPENREIAAIDRKSTRLNSSHTVISYAVFCLKKKKKKKKNKKEN